MAYDCVNIAGTIYCYPCRPEAWQEAYANLSDSQSSGDEVEMQLEDDGQVTY